MHERKRIRIYQVKGKQKFMLDFIILPDMLADISIIWRLSVLKCTHIKEQVKHALPLISCSQLLIFV